MTFTVPGGDVVEETSDCICVERCSSKFRPSTRVRRRAARPRSGEPAGRPIDDRLSAPHLPRERSDAFARTPSPCPDEVVETRLHADDVRLGNQIRVRIPESSVDASATCSQPTNCDSGPGPGSAPPARGRPRLAHSRRSRCPRPGRLPRPRPGRGQARMSPFLYFSETS